MKVTSGKYFRLTILGEIPPGLTDQQAGAWAADAISIALPVAQQVLTADMEVLSELPGKDGQGPSIVQ